ncbi:MAG: CHAT domain-containing protein [Pyrinomonadaceae bacterium]
MIVFALVLMSVAGFPQSRQETIPSLYLKGLFDQIVERGPGDITKLERSGQLGRAAEIALPTCRSYIQLGRYDDATLLVDRLAAEPNLTSRFPASAAALYFCKASVLRAKRDITGSLKNLTLGFSLAPDDSGTLAGYYLEVGRTLYSAGYDFAAIIWLEKAENVALTHGHTSTYHDALRFLSSAWSAKSYYANALAYAEKLLERSSRGGFDHRNRIAHLELASLLDLTGQPRRATDVYLKGLSLSSRARVNYHSGQFLSSLLLRSLYGNDIEGAQSYLEKLESIDQERQFKFERFLGRALVENYRGNRLLSDEYFSKLAKEQGTSDFIVPYWKGTIAERDQNWKELVNNTETLRKLTEESNYSDDLPGIYYKLALGNWRLGDEQSAKEYAAKSLLAFESFRNSPKSDLSLAMMEIHHSIYRLLCEIETTRDPGKAFEYSERLKANLLRDRIEGSGLKPRPDLTAQFRTQLFDTSRDLVEGRASDEALAKVEKSVISERQTDGRVSKDFSSNLLKLPDNTAVVSYEFTTSGELLGFVIEAGKQLRVVRLGIREEQASELAKETLSKIKERIFFKSNGKQLFDLLLKPFDLGSQHLVIVPDKLLWRIPFQALSPDGKRYLIETNTISYSPSVYFLKQSLASPSPRRRSIKIFANDTFDNRRLKHVNNEATSIGALFGTSPRLTATKSDFIASASNADILHFSMHGQLDSENPLSSFLAFMPNRSDSGRLTVNDLLSIRLKPNNLAFLASCDTSKVHNGEGLVSIPWAILGSGSSSVISSQWEAADNATYSFATAFYAEYLKGHSTSTALQKSAISMIHDKKRGFHEPNFWATFSLLGDFR